MKTFLLRWLAALSITLFSGSFLSALHWSVAVILISLAVITILAWGRRGYSGRRDQQPKPNRAETRDSSTQNPDRSPSSQSSLPGFWDSHYPQNILLFLLASVFVVLAIGSLPSLGLQTWTNWLASCLLIALVVGIAVFSWGKYSHSEEFSFSSFWEGAYPRLVTALTIIGSIMCHVWIASAITGKPFFISNCRSPNAPNNFLSPDPISYLQGSCFHNIRFYLVSLSVTAALIGIFSIPYFAYLFYKSPNTQLERIRQDLKILGLITEEKYENFGELYKNFHHPITFICFILLLTVVSSIIVTSFYLAKTGTSYPGIIPITVQQVEIIFYAFLGSYLFGVRLLIRRYNTFDVQPQVYASIISRMIVSVAIAFGISTLLGSSQPLLGSSQTPADSQNFSQGGDNSKELLPWQIAAFLIGIFPEQGLRWLVIIGRRAFRDSTLNEYHERPLRKIVGINEWHEARLEELGIDDAQGLATANISKLLLTTQFDTMQVISWIDQAILYMKVGTQIDKLLAVQITTYYELHTLLEKVKSESQTEKEPEKNNGKDTNSNECKINDLIEILKKNALPENDHSKLLIALGFTLNQLERLCDYSNYPNFICIQEYYNNLDNITRQQAKQETKLIINSTAIGVVMVDFEEENKEKEAKSNPEKENQAKKLEFQLTLSKLSYRNKIHIRLELGKLYYSLGKLREALDIYNKILDEPSSNLLDEKTEFDVYFGRGLVNLFLGKKDSLPIYLQDAVRDFNRAAVLKPSCEALNNCAVAYGYQGDNDSALKTIEAALQLDKRKGIAYYNRGVFRNALIGQIIEKKAEDLQKSEQDFEKAELLGYQSASLWVAWGLAKINMGRYEDAVRCCGQGISLNNSSFLLYSRRGFAYYQLWKFGNGSPQPIDSYSEQASRDFEKAIVLGEKAKVPERKLLPVYLNYGNFLLEQKCYEEALKHYEKIVPNLIKFIELPSVKNELYRNLGLTYFIPISEKINAKPSINDLTQGEKEEVKDKLTKAVENFEKVPATDSMFLFLGDVFSHLASANEWLWQICDEPDEVKYCQNLKRNAETFRETLALEVTQLLNNMNNINIPDGEWSVPEGADELLSYIQRLDGVISTMQEQLKVEKEHSKQEIEKLEKLLKLGLDGLPRVNEILSRT